MFTSQANNCWGNSFILKTVLFQITSFKIPSSKSPTKKKENPMKKFTILFTFLILRKKHTCWRWLNISLRNFSFFKYFKPCGPHTLFHNYSILPLWCESSCRQDTHEWERVHAKNSLLQNTLLFGLGPQVYQPFLKWGAYLRETEHIQKAQDSKWHNYNQNPTILMLVALEKLLNVLKCYPKCIKG